MNLRSRLWSKDRDRLMVDQRTVAKYRHLKREYGIIKLCSVSRSVHIHGCPSPSRICCVSTNAHVHTHIIHVCAWRCCSIPGRSTIILNVTCVHTRCPVYLHVVLCTYTLSCVHTRWGIDHALTGDRSHNGSKLFETN